jgi:hypothetical protein
MDPAPLERRARRTSSARRASCHLFPAATRPAALPLAILLLACACGGEGPRQISKTRETQVADGELRLNATPQERFRLQRMGPASAGPTAGLDWDLPAGWVELPASAMRQANFLAAGDQRAECYLTILPGDGGGLAANVNRWRKQMSLDPLGGGAIDALPRGELFGEPATAVDLEGTWKGMSGTEAGEGYRLVGLLQVTGGEARFLKLVGPKDVVDREVEAFQALARSFQKGGAASSPHAAGNPHAASNPHAGLAAAPSGSSSPNGLSWSAPAGWTRTGDRPMREVTFQVGAGGTGECYVSLLGGDGGGLLPNINRWRRQMGADEISEAALADLPGVAMCGAQGVVVEFKGRFEGMGGETVDDALLLGAVCLLGDRSVFVKFIGPEPVVAPEREAFLGFCRSLELGR